MRFARVAYAVFFFTLGLGVAPFWSQLGGSSRVLGGGTTDADGRSNDGEPTPALAGIGGQETVVFLRQFKDMTIRIKKDPFDAWASPDGRFVIRLFGSNETIASDLYYPEIGGAVKLRVREYQYSAGGRTFGCSFGRSVKDPKITEVHFRLIDAKGRELVYVDSDGDGRWDRFADYTQDPPKFYNRDGLCWKERVKGASLPKK